jgi:hypothetical protein
MAVYPDFNIPAFGSTSQYFLRTRNNHSVDNIQRKHCHEVPAQWHNYLESHSLTRFRTNPYNFIGLCENLCGYETQGRGEQVMTFWSAGTRFRDATGFFAFSHQVYIGSSTHPASRPRAPILQRKKHEYRLTSSSQKLYPHEPHTPSSHGA